LVNVGAIIQARSNSARLKNKVLLPLPFNGAKTILNHIIDRISLCNEIKKIIIATTSNIEDDIIEKKSIADNVDFFRGSENNVLERFYFAAKKFNLDIIIRLTADNPCIDPLIITQVLSQHINKKADYTDSNGLPLGMNVEVISFEALEKSFLNAKELYELEHVTPYIYKRTDVFKIQTINFNINPKLSDLRFTIDYPSDYAFSSLIFDKLYEKNNCFGLSEIEVLLREFPWLKYINTNNYQKKSFNSIDEEIDAAMGCLNDMDLKNASNILSRIYHETK